MNDIVQSNEPVLIVRGSRFAMPFLAFTVLLIIGCYFYVAQSNPFMSFGDVAMPFIAAIGGCISINFQTRATFFDDRIKIGRTVVAYDDVVGVTRGRFLMTLLYRRPNDTRGKPRRARLSFYEMRRAEQEKCLEILRARLPARAVSGL